MAIPYDSYAAYYGIHWMKIPAAEILNSPACKNCQTHWTDRFAEVKVLTNSSWKDRRELMEHIFRRHHDNECPAHQLEGSERFEERAREIARQRQEEDMEVRRVAKLAAKQAARLAERRLEKAEDGRRRMIASKQNREHHRRSAPAQRAGRKQQRRRLRLRRPPTRWQTASRRSKTQAMSCKQHGGQRSPRASAEDGNTLHQLHSSEKRVPEAFAWHVLADLTKALCFMHHGMCLLIARSPAAIMIAQMRRTKMQTGTSPMTANNYPARETQAENRTRLARLIAAQPGFWKWQQELSNMMTENQAHQHARYWPQLS